MIIFSARNSVLLQRFMVYLVIGLSLAACVSGVKDGDGDNKADEITITEEIGVDVAITEQFKLAVAHIQKQEYEPAIDILKDVTAKTDKHSAPYVNLGIAYAKTGKIKEAEENLLIAKKINPEHPVTNNELGIIYRQSGRFDEARAIYEKILTRYPMFLPARKNLGILCDIFIKDLECAIEHYQAYLEVKQDDKEVNIWLTDVKQRAGVK